MAEFQIQILQPNFQSNFVPRIRRIHLFHQIYSFFSPSVHRNFYLLCSELYIGFRFGKQTPSRFGPHRGACCRMVNVWRHLSDGYSTFSRFFMSIHCMVCQLPSLAGFCTLDHPVGGLISHTFMFYICVVTRQNAWACGHDPCTSLFLSFVGPADQAFPYKTLLIRLGPITR